MMNFRRYSANWQLRFTRSPEEQAAAQQAAAEAAGAAGNTSNDDGVVDADYTEA